MTGCSPSITRPSSGSSEAADRGRQLAGRRRWRLLDQKDAEGARLALFKAQLGSPKNKRLLKALQEQGVKQTVQRMELDYLADRKLGIAKQQYGDLENDLFYVLDEKGHTVHLTDRGVEAMGADPRPVRAARYLDGRASHRPR